jgi:ankyrin repeat protein
MKLLTILCAISIAVISFQAVAEELPVTANSVEKLPVEAQKMLDDLGTPEEQQKNNGTPLRCRNGGTKTVHISSLADATMFSSDFNNCREDGSTRDGYYELIVRNWEIIGQSKKRSINGILHDAVRDDQIKKVRSMIAKGADVNYAESIPVDGGGTIEEWTPLMYAAMTGNIKMIKLLVKSGADVNFMNSRAMGSLNLASASGSLESVKYLVSKKAKINSSDIEGVTPLTAAVIKGHYPVVRYLIDVKADIHHIHKDGDSALMFALANGHTRIAQMLIDSGVDINIRNKYGTTALFIAIAENNSSMVRELIRHNADLTVRTETDKSLMDVAAAKGNESIINMLRQAGDASAR